ncbi:hypothetical protein SYNPS1DRAFT_30320 [Syncephalis pseudoplumigaleata]|uniref:Uncharacterized protein n=1 Tax=Syncephalis pseudoplumigaleata TaxID=1712513 RepID=A0A4P9YVJ7_9FUNG|nr:hypothetical protein SYNPS1DRAFT_30320 [Syncephalis pseudoplumigaleata]|eukprot:RKP23914.1 hypothetical protein SYNPS1DRAFT_30320 [Syncephalis pseudoplumigaleata]
MTITSANITNPQEDYFTMQMAGMVTDTGPFDAQIEIKDKVRLYYEGVELGRMKMDPLVTKAGVGATIDSSLTFEVTNKEGFGDFAKIMMRKDEFTWSIKGEARARAMGITLDGIKLEKDITLKGMQNFPNVKLKSFDLPSNHPLGGITINADASMENPSPFGIELGDLTFDIFYNKLRIVSANVTGVTITPGVNVMSMHGRLLPQPREEDRDNLSGMLSDYVAGKPSKTKVVGVEVRPNAQSKPISWLQRGFAGTTLDFVFDGSGDMKLIQSLELGPMGMDFSAAEPWSPRTSAPNVLARFKMPFGFPVEMKRIAQDVTVTEGGVAMATMDVPWTEASGTSASGMMKTGINGVPMNVLGSQHARFSQFVHDLAMGPSKSMSMRGNAAAVVGTAVGDLTIKGVKFDETITIRGLEGLASIPITVDKILVKGGTTEYLEIELTVTIGNPADLSMSAGDVYFQCFFAGQLVGRVKLPDLRVKPGANTIQSTVYFMPQTEAARAAGRKMMSDYVKGIENNIGISGYAQSTNIASLQQALGAIRMTTKMPAMHDVKMIRATRVAIGIGTVFTRKAKGQVDMYNPLDAPIAVLRMKVKMFYKGASLGDLDQDLSANPIMLAPKAISTSPPITVGFALNLDTIKAAFSMLGGKLYVDVQANIVARIGGYVMTLDYSQQNLHAELVGRLS